jgi:hypothetical protein
VGSRVETTFFLFFIFSPFSTLFFRFFLFLSTYRHAYPQRHVHRSPLLLH